MTSAPMTWAEFVTLVERQLQEQGIPREVPLAFIDWDASAFVYHAPELYCQLADGALMITERPED